MTGSDQHFANIIGYIFFIKDFYLLICGERNREGEREGEKHQYMVASHPPPTGEPAHNPGKCPDWESNRQLFGSQPSPNPLSYTSQVIIGYV